MIKSPDPLLEAQRKPWTVWSFQCTDRFVDNDPQKPIVRPARFISRHVSETAAIKAAKNACRGYLFMFAENVVEVRWPGDGSHSMWWKVTDVRDRGYYLRFEKAELELPLHVEEEK